MSQSTHRPRAQPRIPTTVGRRVGSVESSEGGVDGDMSPLFHYDTRILTCYLDAHGEDSALVCQEDAFVAVAWLVFHLVRAGYGLERRDGRALGC